MRFALALQEPDRPVRHRPPPRAPPGTAATAPRFVSMESVQVFRSIRVAARDRARLAEIAGIVARFGLGALALHLGLGEPQQDETSGAQGASPAARADDA
ncbi:hypothetical protein MTR62_11755, partial [Novosphingobium sp. 1949]|nr:hypothetical protein [Novosphingobium organovorum]